MARCEVLCEVLSVIQNQFKTIKNSKKPELQLANCVLVSPLDKFKGLNRVKVTLSIGNQNLCFYSLISKIQSPNHNSNDSDAITANVTNQQVNIESKETRFFQRFIFFLFSKFDWNLFEKLNEILAKTSEVPLIKLEPQTIEPNIESELDLEYNQLKMRYESLLSSFEMDTKQPCVDTITLTKDAYRNLSQQVVYLENEFDRMKVNPLSFFFSLSLLIVDVLSYGGFYTFREKSIIYLLCWQESKQKRLFVTKPPRQTHVHWSTGKLRPTLSTIYLTLNEKTRTWKMSRQCMKHHS